MVNSTRDLANLCVLTPSKVLCSFDLAAKSVVAEMLLRQRHAQ